MKNSEVRRLAAESFVDTLELIGKSGAVVYPPELRRSMSSAIKAAVERLYQAHTAKLEESGDDDTRTAAERLRFIIEVRALLAKPASKNEHESSR